MKIEEVSLEPTSLVLLDGLRYAARITHAFGDHLLPPKPGIYFVDTADPVLDDSRYYYTPSSFVTGVAITSLDDVTEEIWDKEGNIVLPIKVIRNRKRYLTSIPTVPSTALGVVQVAAGLFLDSLIHHDLRTTHANELYQYLKPSAQKPIAEGELDQACETLYSDIRTFVGRDKWHIYYIHRVNTTIHVEKTIDYRIYDWTRQMLEKRSGIPT